MIKKLLKSVKKVIFPHWTDYWPDIINFDVDKKVLNIGPGKNKIKNTISIDINESLKPNIVWNLNKTPWPIESNSIDQIIALNILEHLEDSLSIFEELHRISKPNGTIYINCPHFSSGGFYADPTHKSFFSSRTFDFFVTGEDIEKNFGFYKSFRFILKKRLIQLVPFFRYIPILLLLINKFPTFWENYLCFIIRGEGIFYKLKVLK